MSDKPVIFISHSSDDEELAYLIGQQIENACNNQVRAFVARYSIPAGEEWHHDILQNLKAAQALIVLVSPSSAKSRWVGFEIGYLWPRISRKGKGKLSVYPLCLPNSLVFSPLDNKQGKSLNSSEETKEVFEKICNQFNGDIAKCNVEAILAKVNPHNEINLSDIDIKAILDDYLRDKYKVGNWILYSKLYQELELNLPEGAIEAHLVNVATEKRGLVIDEATNTGVKFKNGPIGVASIDWW